MKLKRTKRRRERRKRWAKKWSMGAKYGAVKIDKPVEVNVVEPKIGWFRRLIIWLKKYLIKLWTKQKEK